MTAIVRVRRGCQAVALVLVVIAFALALAGIASSGAAAEETARSSRTATVDIVNFAYKPPTLMVGRGSTVVFANTSRTAHTATRKGSFTTGRIKAGKSVSVRFGQKGTFAYHCTIHPFMKGKVIVD
ncbi:MAG TPA: cupredoxin domain-containing protein [Solirubrobacterales bacterium]|nr:cupredoxin domain-containing protein [Solirubrobacterales bacterium]